MWEAKPGMKVVCIRDFSSYPVCKGKTLPIINKIYTIEAVDTCVFSKYVVFHLVEIGRQLVFANNQRYTLAFEKEGFRPLVSNKGMEVLQEILKNPNKKISGFEQSKTKVKQGA